MPLCGRCHGLAHDMARPQDIGTLTREGIERARAAGKVWGRPVTVPNEIRSIIKRLRAEGKSYPYISNLLNQLSVPTAQGGKQWYPATVRNIALSYETLKLDQG